MHRDDIICMNIVHIEVYEMCIIYITNTARITPIP